MDLTHICWGGQVCEDNGASIAEAERIDDNGRGARPSLRYFGFAVEVRCELGLVTQVAAGGEDEGRRLGRCRGMRCIVEKAYKKGK